MFYELSEDGLSKVPANMGAHQARLREFHGRGLLLMAGALWRAAGGLPRRVHRPVPPRRSSRATIPSC
jgi:uncharacterized protein YciI